jgi:hypothetical protein
MLKATQHILPSKTPIGVLLAFKLPCVKLEHRGGCQRTQLGRTERQTQLGCHHARLRTPAIDTFFFTFRIRQFEHHPVFERANHQVTNTVAPRGSIVG